MITIKTDSRKVQKGDTFVALRGISRDGHEFIEKAIEQGATKIVAEEGNYSVFTELVPDTRVYLEEELKSHYNSKIDEMNLIGITGTNGKTTTAWFLYQALNAIGSKTAYIGTIGFYIDSKVCSLPNTTVDLCDMYELLMEAYEQGCSNVVMEVSSHALAMGRIKTLSFDAAIFTNLTQDHLDYHKTMEEYAKAKQILFHHVKKDGYAFVNVDDMYKDYFIIPENHTITYGFQEADFQVGSYQMSSKGTTFSYCFNGEETLIETNLIGRYNVYNCIATIAFLETIGVKKDKIETVFQTIKAPSGRIETIPFHSNSIVIDYAHTPDAIENIISTIQELALGHIYVVFGCTGDRDRTKRPIMASLVSKMSDYFIITNDDPHFEDPNQIVDDMTRDLVSDHYEVCLDRRKAIQRGISLLKENDVLLILGKGHEEFMVIGRDQIPFHDSKVVMELITEQN